MPSKDYGNSLNKDDANVAADFARPPPHPLCAGVKAKPNRWHSMSSREQASQSQLPIQPKWQTKKEGTKNVPNPNANGGQLILSPPPPLLDWRQPNPRRLPSLAAGWAWPPMGYAGGGPFPFPSLSPPSAVPRIFFLLRSFPAAAATPAAHKAKVGPRPAAVLAVEELRIKEAAPWPRSRTSSFPPLSSSGRTTAVSQSGSNPPLPSNGTFPSSFHGSSNGFREWKKAQSGSLPAVVYQR
jgi:hypothetical protein